MPRGKELAGRLSAWLGAALVALTVVVAQPAAAAAPALPAAAPAVGGTETDLGIAIPGVPGTVRSEQSDQGVLADGRYLAYYASDGGPGVAARFLAMALDGTLAAEVPIPQGTNVESLVYSPTSKTVFVAANGTGASYLYEWDGATLQARTTISGHEVMRLAVAPDGALYIGTFAASNGRLYRWSGGTLTDLGQPFPGESYVRSLAVDATYVWASNDLVGGAKLVRITRSGNTRTTIATPASFATERSAFSMTRTGDFLFLRTVNSNRLYAYDVAAGAFRTFNDQVLRDRTVPEVANPVEYLDGVSQFAQSPVLEGRYVYLQRANAGVMRVDVTDGLKAIRVDKYHQADNTSSMAGASVANAQSWAWLTDVGGRSGDSLVATTADGRIVVNTRGQSAQLVLEMPAQDSPSRIDTLGSDSAGRIYSGGFDLPAGIGLYSPSGGTSSVLAGPQIEGFGRFNSSVVMGGYTGVAEQSGPLYVYDGSGQPVFRRYLGNSQERPVALTQVGSQVAIGSVPIKNTLGGALSIWNPATNALTVERNLIPDQSVISLGTHNGLVVGGSSNVGGTGSTPTAARAQLFTYNPATRAVKTFTPPGFASSTYSFVAAITPDPAQPGRFWAISTGYLIQFQVAADGTITLTKNLTTIPNTSSPTGKGLGIAFVGTTMFATVDGTISAVNTETGERTVVAATTATGPVVGLATDTSGNLYYARGPHLYRFAPTGTTPRVPTATEKYVTAVYRDLFGRTPDPKGLANWTTALTTGTPRSAVADAITGSNEYRSRLITTAYADYLGRTPDAGGLANWLAAMRAGLTIQQMESGFISSAEYYGKAGGTPATWVRQLYADVLDRTAGASEVDHWVSFLARGGSRSQVALGFLLSTEHLATVIDGHYQHLLGRGLDASGKVTWVRAIQNGTRIEVVIAGIIASTEYWNRNTR